MLSYDILCIKLKGCSFELSPSFSLSFFAPKLTEGTSTKKLPEEATFLCRCLQNLVTQGCKIRSRNERDQNLHF